jgi:hypothetical protein
MELLAGLRLGSSNERSVEFTNAFRDGLCLARVAIIEMGAGSLVEFCDLRCAYRPRKPWISEDLRMGILDVAGLGLVFLRPKIYRTNFVGEGWAVTGK